MNVIEGIKYGIAVAARREVIEPVVRAPARRIRAPRTLGGMRLRHSSDHGQGLIGNAMHTLAPLAADQTWRAQNLDNRALDRTSPAKLLELLADISPEVSKGLWDFLRLCNPGYTATAMRLSGSGPAPKAAQDALTALLNTLKTRHGDTNVVIGRLFIGAFLRGAFAGELVLDKTGRVALDLATPDPSSFEFKQVDDPDLGVIWQAGQWQKGQWVPLDIETVRYVPIDPFPGSPYGRSLASPALFPCLFLITLLHDLKRVVQQQGYPRLDLAIQIEKLKASMPEEAEDDPEMFAKWLDDLTTQVSAAYSALEPDDAYIHTDAVAVNRPVGAVDASSLGAIDSLVKLLERMATRALKSMPLLMGTSEGTSEANANRQWEIHAAGIKALQHLCEGLLEHLLTLAMQAQGYACTVQFRFAELRAAEMLRDAQTEEKRINNARAKYEAGWISQDEAAQEVTGHAADVPEPRSAAKAAQTQADMQADPGSNR
jgi:hypothetical protein